MTAARLEGVRRSGIREVMDLAAGREDVVRLEVGEPDFATPPHVVEAAARAARAGMTRYTPSRGIATLRAAAAAKLANVNGFDADPATDVVVTAGAANGLLVALAAAVDPGDVVLVPDPGWPNYGAMATMLGLRVERYMLPPSVGFQPDVDEVGDLLRRTGARAIVVNSPSNPTGAVLDADVVVRLVEVAASAGAVVVADECYDQIRLEPGASTQAVAAHVPGAPVVSVFSLSKTYAMTGWRIGYLCGPAPTVAAIAQIQETWLSCCSAPVQAAAEAALTGDQSVVAEMVAAYRRRRDHAVAVARGAGLAVHPPAGAFYLLVDVATSDAAGFARDLVVRDGVAVAPGETFGSQTATMVRVSLAADEASIERGLRAIAARHEEAVAC